METITFCTLIMCLSPVGALRVHPNRSQFFLYDSLSLSCGGEENSSEWKCWRNTTSKQECCDSLDIRNNSTCFYDVLYQKDSGVYWCESAAGERSDAVNITVTRLSVILESPAVPVTEGDDVTLRCLTDTPPSSSGFTAFFYKDSLPFWSSSMANVTLRRVSKANEGLYKCNISGKGESPASWLTVRVGHPDRPGTLLAHILLPVVSGGLMLVALMLLGVMRSQRGTDESDVSYADITITHGAQSNRIIDMHTEATFYSMAKPGST